MNYAPGSKTQKNLKLNIRIEKEEKLAPPFWWRILALSNP
jgi:hypothetical protein